MIVRDHKGRIPNYVILGSEMIHQPSGLRIDIQDNNYAGAHKVLKRRVKAHYTTPTDALDAAGQGRAGGLLECYQQQRKTDMCEICELREETLQMKQEVDIRMAQFQIELQNDDREAADKCEERVMELTRSILKNMRDASATARGEDKPLTH